jgi:signal transduction histidine kinase
MNFNKNWLSDTSWRVIAVGVAAALLLAAALMTWMMNPPWEDLLQLVYTLTVTSVLSLLVGYVLFRRGRTRSPSLSWTLVFTYGWGALLNLINIWAIAQLMFASPHDLALVAILLLFAFVIATTFGVLVARHIAEGMKLLADKAQRVAGGDFSARVEIGGQDELAQAAASFNDMAQQLQGAAAQRQEVEKLRRDLIAWTSHDLRTPLTSIRAMVEALHDGVVTDGATVSRYYRTMRADVIALNDLIDDLFELAQLDTGSLKLDMFPHSLHDLISDTLESLQVIARQKEITLCGEVAPDIDPVTLNAPKMGRVLANLIGNALKYTPSGGTVQVIARREQATVKVVVEDTGTGFDAKDLPRVFEQFYRGEEARSRTTGGAGLGLAIAKGVVEAHRGRIWAENVPGGGARVSFLLPV